MKEILTYLIALEKFKNEPATLEKTKQKFPNKDVEQILSQFIGQMSFSKAFFQLRLCPSGPYALPHITLKNFS